MRKSLQKSNKMCSYPFAATAQIDRSQMHRATSFMASNALAMIAFNWAADSWTDWW